MISNISIGKYTLESLTTGMYATPLDLYREYIQNSVDSIDQATQNGIIKKGEDRIIINIDNENFIVTIEDNGVGISVDNALVILTDIGNSNKIYTYNRGFRGIGRLAGLSYCERLSFITSTLGESKKIKISFDCHKLRQLLVPGQDIDYDLSKVIMEVTQYKVTPESAGKHYFIVEMEGIEDTEGILNEENIEDYLVQVAPLPYNDDTFKWGKEIKDKLHIKGYVIGEYNIFIQKKGSTKQIFKANSDIFFADRLKRQNDNIKNIEIKEIFDENGKVSAVLWYSISNFYGGILDERLKGLRLRKGNILVGDKNSLNNIFKEDRFNSWFQGEVHIINSQIIPNARRDNFEKNKDYLNLLTELSKLGEVLSKQIRSISSSRNDKNIKMLNEAEQLIKKTDQLLEDGFNSQKEKQTVATAIEEFREKVKDTKVNDEINSKRKIDVFKQLDILFDNVKGATNFKILNFSQKLTVEQKRLLEKVFETLTEQCEKDEADRLIGKIMEKFN